MAAAREATGWRPPRGRPSPTRPPPAIPEPTSFTYTATNGGGTSAAATATITVTAPTLSVSGSPPSGTVAVAYNASFSGVLGSGAYTFLAQRSASGPDPERGRRPVGRADHGREPSAPRSQHTDANGATGDQTFSITIGGPNTVHQPRLPGGTRRWGCPSTRPSRCRAARRPTPLQRSAAAAGDEASTRRPACSRARPAREGSFSFTHFGVGFQRRQPARAFSTSVSLSLTVGGPVPPSS
ncbi:hypothetical protein ACRAWD_30995 [Caulobacter segnis]